MSDEGAGTRRGGLHEGNALEDLVAVLPGDTAARRRLLVRSAARIVATAVGLFALYAVLPTPDESEGTAIVGIVLGLAAFCAVVWWQIRTIVNSQHPVLRAVEVVAFAIPLLIVVFAYVYLWLSRTHPGAFSEPLDRIDAVYFTVSIITTLGFGDISALNSGARLLVTVHMILDLALIAGVARLIVMAARTGLRRRDAQ